MIERVIDGLVPSAHAQPATPVTTPETVEPEKQYSRVVLIANDLFVANGVVTQVGNLDLFLNSANYLMQDSELIGIRPRELRQTVLTLNPQNIRQVWGFILIVAGLFVVFGIKAARRRAVLAA